MPLRNHFPWTRAAGVVTQISERIFTDNFGIVLAEGSSSAFAEIYTRTLTPADLAPFKGQTLSIIVSFDYAGPAAETSTCRLTANEVQISDNKRVAAGAATSCQFVLWNVDSNRSIKFDIDGFHTSGNAGSATITNVQITARVAD